VANAEWLWSLLMTAAADDDVQARARRDDHHVHRWMLVRVACDDGGRLAGAARA
jgi:hypothetical protein